MRTKRKEKDSAQQTGDKINDGGKQTAAQRKKSLLEKARQHRKAIGENLHDAVVAEQYGAVSAAVERSTSTKQKSQTLAWQTRLDRIVTGRISGFLFMFVLFTIVFWITVSGANIPSAALSLVLIGKAVPLLHAGAAAILLPPCRRISTGRTTISTCRPLMCCRRCFGSFTRQRSAAAEQ